MFDSLMIFKPEILETTPLTAILPSYIKYVHIATKQSPYYLRLLDKMGYGIDYMYYTKVFLTCEADLIEEFKCKSYVMFE